MFLEGIRIGILIKVKDMYDRVVLDARITYGSQGVSVVMLTKDHLFSTCVIEVTTNIQERLFGAT